MISGYRIFPVHRDVAPGPRTTAIRIEDIGRPAGPAVKDPTRRET
jgi:hypothetical protein